EAHCNLGNALKAKGLLDDAIAECREALRIKPELAEAHCSLGSALQDKGQLDEAIEAYREALRIKKDFALAHNNLGIPLEARGQLDEAIAAYREAVRLNKDFAEAHCNLGLLLGQQGQFREALEEVRRGHELGSRNPGWRYPSAQWVRQSERLVELDERLSDFLERKTMPANPREWIELAVVCSRKQLHPAATRFYEGAFAADPKLLDDLGSG